VSQWEELSRVSPVWQGARLTEVHTVYIWPNGYITCYTDEDGNQNEGVIYPPDAIERLEFGAL
jgi:hypothetical protein